MPPNSSPEGGSLEKIKRAADLKGVEGVVSIVILDQYWQNDIGPEEMAEALARVRLLSMGDVHRRRWEEAERAGLVLKPGERLTGLHGEFYTADNNKDLYYLGMTFMPDFPEENIQGDQPEDREMDLLKSWEEKGINIDMVHLIPAEDPNDGPYNFSPISTNQPEEKPRVFRVWVRVGPNLAKSLEDRTSGKQ